MKIVHPSFEIISKLDGKEALKQIERVARTCYKSEHLITDESAAKMVKRLLESKHEAMLEFYDITVKFTCDRAIANEIVRHRVASYAQESTRYCDYSKDKFDGELSFICPEWLWCESGVYDKIGDTWYINGKEQVVFGPESDQPATNAWLNAMQNAENSYLELRQLGWTAEKARVVLPLETKTEINMKCNLREWRHFFKLRCHHTAHPDVRALAKRLLYIFTMEIPVVFDDLCQMFIMPNLDSDVVNVEDLRKDYIAEIQSNIDELETEYLNEVLNAEPIATAATLEELFENDKSITNEQERTESAIA